MSLVVISRTAADSSANAVASQNENAADTARDIGRATGIANHGRESHKPLLGCAAVASGAILGLAAPGLEQWYLAWFGVAPLIVLIKSSPSWRTAALRSFLFGWSYNLVYMHWYLQLHSATWDAMPYPMLVSAFCWLAECARQGAMVAAFGVLCFKLPLAASFSVKRIRGRLCLPALILIPICWVLSVNKVGNALCIQGVPWTMLEYTQYKQVELIQSASVIGGIGLCALILMMNTLWACTFATLWAVRRRKDFSDSALYSLPEGLTELAFPTRRAAVSCTSIFAFLTFTVMLAGHWVGESMRTVAGPVTVSCLQGNLTRRIDGATEQDLINRYSSLAAQAPAGLCVWPESAIPVPFRKHAAFFKDSGQFARQSGQSWVVGTMDQEGTRHFNTAVFIDDTGSVRPDVYHKRYLVPVSEYTPWWLRFEPLITLFKNGTMTGFLESTPGTAPCVFEQGDMRISPQLCFDILSAEIVGDSVRSGANLLVSSCNTSWFRSAAMSDQMLSFLALRAVEFHRQIAYANVCGASAIVSANGKIVSSAPREKSCVVTGSVALYNDMTPFSRWFR